MALPRITVSSGGNDVASSTGSLVVGARIGVDAIVDDPIVADRHCEFFHDGAFRVRDLGSVTGTWVDGRRAAPVSDLLNGTKIVIGSSTLVAKVGYDGGTPTLELELERQSFWWKKPSKGTFDNDPDALVRSEVAFGRFPALALGNRLAALAGAVLLVAATFASSVMGTLADAGPLLTAHAALQDGSLVVADAQTGLRRCQEIATAQGCRRFKQRSRTIRNPSTPSCRTRAPIVHPVPHPRLHPFAADFAPTGQTAPPPRPPRGHHTFSPSLRDARVPRRRTARRQRRHFRKQPQRPEHLAHRVRVVDRRQHAPRSRAVWAQQYVDPEHPHQQRRPRIAPPTRASLPLAMGNPQPFA